MRALGEEIGIPIEVSILYKATYINHEMSMFSTLNLTTTYKRLEIVAQS